eukprot:scaffold86532_cov67-Phaeocystis_antarctica.AAC.1
MGRGQWGCGDGVVCAAARGRLGAASAAVCGAPQLGGVARHARRGEGGGVARPAACAARARGGGDGGVARRGRGRGEAAAAGARRSAALSRHGPSPCVARLGAAAAPPPRPAHCPGVTAAAEAEPGSSPRVLGRPSPGARAARSLAGACAGGSCDTHAAAALSPAVGTSPPPGARLPLPAPPPRAAPRCRRVARLIMPTHLEAAPPDRPRGRAASAAHAVAHA